MLGVPLRALKCYEKNMNTPWFENIGGAYQQTLPGRAIIINGPSSSGKTTIAGALQKQLYSEQGEVFLYTSIDTFASQHFPSAFLGDEENLIQITPVLVHAFHRTIRAMLESGHNVIVDHVLQEPWWAEDLNVCLSEIECLSVRLHAPIHVLQEREKDRKDRTAGLATFQHNTMRYTLRCDIQIDTSQIPLESCIHLIRKEMPHSFKTSLR